MFVVAITKPLTGPPVPGADTLAAKIAGAANITFCNASVIGFIASVIVFIAFIGLGMVGISTLLEIAPIFSSNPIIIVNPLIAISSIISNWECNLSAFSIILFLPSLLQEPSLISAVNIFIIVSGLSSWSLSSITFFLPSDITFRLTSVITLRILIFILFLIACEDILY